MGSDLKGVWVQVNDPCLFTPGGDPVYRCSLCGKGDHLNGIEFPQHLDKCPACGAFMTGYDK